VVKPGTPPPSGKPTVAPTTSPLASAMMAKRVPYKVSQEEAADYVKPSQLPDDAQSTVREQLRGLLGYLNVHHHGLKRGAKVYRFQQSTENYGQYDLGTGAITINEDVHQRATKFMSEPTNPKYRKHADDASTLIHETIHAMSPMQSKAYDGHGAFIEEATTEILARKVMRDKFQIPDEHWCDDDGTPSGSYGEEIHSLNQIVSSVLGQHAPIAHQDVYRLIEDAAAKMRQQSQVFDRKNRYVRHFANNLELPPHLFTGLDANAAAARRLQIVSDVSAEVERQHHDWQG